MASVYGPVCHAPGATVVSVGAVASMRIVWEIELVWLPALSNTRVCNVWVPSATIGTAVLFGSLWTPWPSSSHSTWSMPEVGSKPITDTDRLLCVHATVPESVWSLGTLLSIL